MPAMQGYSKGARGLSSSREYFASSRKIQFHWDDARDSRKVVTPFMRASIKWRGISLLRIVIVTTAVYWGLYSKPY